ncbi:MAG: hypothetical protein J6Y00_06535 [Paludibacteraceae bacterium]|nr:hypothetical protein [Paludibacteraceae bacterium]
MKTFYRFPLLLMSIVTIFLASCGDMKNNVNGVDVIADDDTYVAVGDFTSDSPMFKEPLTGRTVAVDLNDQTADMTLYNFELGGAVMTILVKGLDLANTSETSCAISNGNAEIIPIVKMADKDVLYNNCPITRVNGTIDTKEKTMYVEFTIAYNNPLLQQKMDIAVVFNGKLVDRKKIDEVIPEEAKKTVDYEKEFAAKGTLNVDDKIIPDNKLRVAIDKDDMKANLYLATLSLDNGKSFVTLQAQNLNVTETSKGYDLNAETAVPILETNGQSFYYPYCEFRNVHGVIDEVAETMQINLVFVYVDPNTNEKHEYEASFFGTLVDPDEPDEVQPIIYNHDFLASGLFSVDVEDFSIENRMVGVDINGATADITFYAFSYGDQIPEINVKTVGLNLQTTAEGYTLSINEVMPMVQTSAGNVEFKDAVFKDMEGIIDTNKKSMNINFTIVYTDPNTSAVTEIHVGYEGVLMD